MNTPTTFDELVAACKELGLPLDLLHVNLGHDSSSPKCFGIFQYHDTWEWRVYKNDSHGVQKVRYQGHDEAEAVRIIWEKILEIADLAKVPDHVPATSGVPEPVHVPDDRDDDPDTYADYRPVGMPGGSSGYDRRHRRKRPDAWYYVSRSLRILVPSIVAVLLFVLAWTAVARLVRNMPDISFDTGPRRGYYHVDDDYYYHAGNDWWLYDYAIGAWSPYYPQDDWYVYDDYSNYYDGYDWDHDDGYVGWDDWYEDEYGYQYGHQYGYDYDYGLDDRDDDYDYSYDPDWDSDYDWDSDWDSSLSWDYGSDYDYDWDSGSDYDWDSGSSWDSDWDSGYDWDSDW